MAELKTDLGNKIKTLRELRNFTQDYMAEKLGLTQSAYSKIESGETDVAYSKLEKIAELLSLAPEDIIGFNKSLVFNVMHNQTGNGMVVYRAIPDEEKKLYLDQIELLKQENAHLKDMLNRILPAKK